MTGRCKMPADGRRAGCRLLTRLAFVTGPSPVSPDLISMPTTPQHHRRWLQTAGDLLATVAAPLVARPKHGATRSSERKTTRKQSPVATSGCRLEAAVVERCQAPPR